MCIDVLIQCYGYNEKVKNEEQFQCVSFVLGLGLKACPATTAKPPTRYNNK